MNTNSYYLETGPTVSIIDQNKRLMRELKKKLKI